MKIHQIIPGLLVIAYVAALPVLAKAQSLFGSAGSPGTVATTTPVQLGLTYKRPTERTKINYYLFDAFGPHPIFSSAITAGTGHTINSPPEWGQGAESYSRRFVSGLGIAGLGATTRYALSKAFQEDAMYCRCEFQDVFPRLSHTMATFIARRGDSGYRVFSVPAAVGPNAGAMTAIYGWSPDRYRVRNALRMGRFNLLEYVGANISLGFLSSAPRSLRTHLHLNNGYGAHKPGWEPSLIEIGAVEK